MYGGQELLKEHYVGITGLYYPKNDCMIDKN